MALVHYDIRLRRNQRNESIDVFSRFIDFDDPEQMATTDGLLAQLMVDAIKRASGKIEDLWQYDLQLYKRGKSGVEMTFVATVSEIDERDR